MSRAGCIGQNWLFVFFTRATAPTVTHHRACSPPHCVVPIRQTPYVEQGLGAVPGEEFVHRGRRRAPRVGPDLSSTAAAAAARPRPRMMHQKRLHIGRRPLAFARHGDAFRQGAAPCTLPACVRIDYARRVGVVVITSARIHSPHRSHRMSTTKASKRELKKKGK